MKTVIGQKKKKHKPLISLTGGSCDVCYDIEHLTYIMPYGLHLCTKCYISKYRPNISFIKSNSGTFLWSVEDNCHELVGIEYIENCGWFIREVTTNLRIRAEKTYLMEYYGEMACPRCVGIQFPRNTPKCRNPYCYNNRGIK